MKDPEDRMRILVTNDDGIKAPGIEKLVRVAKNFGEVTVVAPASQCSAMSARITITEPIYVKEESFPVEGVKAYSISGTPADCVKVAVEYICKEKPDMVFSGINRGFNAGIEVSYSGTVAAAMEGILKGIPAMAFSVGWREDYGTVDKYLYDVMKELLETPVGKGEMWNVNFPSCPAEECKGILRDRKSAMMQLFPDVYLLREKNGDTEKLELEGKEVTDAPDGTDYGALLRGYISIGKLRNIVFGEE